MTTYEYIVRMKDKASRTIARVSELAGVGEKRLLGWIQKASRAERVTTKWSGSLNFLRRGMATLGLALGIGAITMWSNRVEAATAHFEGLTNAIEFASGDRFTQNRGFLEKRIKELSLDMTAAYEGYSNLAGSLRGTSIEKDINSIFDGVSTAAATLNLSKDQIKGAYLAIGQMASKGKVQAEELRGQLGERIPGAFSIAAASMGVTQEKLNQMLDRGEIMADVFLPRFARELKRVTESGLDKWNESLAASMNRKSNAIKRLTLWVGDRLQPAYIKWNDFIAGKLIPKLQEFLQLIITNWSAIKAYGMEIWSMVKSTAVAFAEFFSAMFGIQNQSDATQTTLSQLTNILDLFRVALEITTTGVIAVLEVLRPLAPMIGVVAGAYAVWTAAQWAINIAMAANPIGAIIVGVVIAIGWIRTLIKHYHEWGAGILMLYGPLGFLINLIQSFRRHWDSIVKAFTEEGIISGIKRIGVVILDALLMPLQQLLKLISKIPGMGHIGALGNRAIDEIRMKLGLEDPDGKKSEQLKFWVPKATPDKPAGSNKTPGFNTAELTDGLKGITGGGARPTNITVNLGKLQEKTEIHVSQFQEGMQEAEEALKEMLLRVLNSTNQIQSA